MFLLNFLPLCFLFMIMSIDSGEKPPEVPTFNYNKDFITDYVQHYENNQDKRNEFWQPIIKNFFTTTTKNEAEKAVEKAYASYKEVFSRILEDVDKENRKKKVLDKINKKQLTQKHKKIQIDLERSTVHKFQNFLRNSLSEPVLINYIQFLWDRKKDFITDYVQHYENNQDNRNELWQPIIENFFTTTTKNEVEKAVKKAYVSSEEVFSRILEDVDKENRKKIQIDLERSTVYEFQNFLRNSLSEPVLIHYVQFLWDKEKEKFEKEDIFGKKIHLPTQEIHSVFNTTFPSLRVGLVMLAEKNKLRNIKNLEKHVENYIRSYQYKHNIKLLLSEKLKQQNVNPEKHPWKGLLHNFIAKLVSDIPTQVVKIKEKVFNSNVENALLNFIIESTALIPEKPIVSTQQITETQEKQSEYAKALQNYNRALSDKNVLDQFKMFLLETMYNTIANDGDRYIKVKTLYKKLTEALYKKKDKAGMIFPFITFVNLILMYMSQEKTLSESQLFFLQQVIDHAKYDKTILNALNTIASDDDVKRFTEFIKIQSNIVSKLISAITNKQEKQEKISKNELLFLYHLILLGIKQIDWNKLLKDQINPYTQAPLILVHKIGNFDTLIRYFKDNNIDLTDTQKNNLNEIIQIGIKAQKKQEELPKKGTAKSTSKSFGIFSTLTKLAGIGAVAYYLNKKLNFSKKLSKFGQLLQKRIPWIKIQKIVPQQY